MSDYTAEAKANVESASKHDKQILDMLTTQHVNIHKTLYSYENDRTSYVELIKKTCEIFENCKVSKGLNAYVIQVNNLVTTNKNTHVINILEDEKNIFFIGFKDMTFDINYFHQCIFLQYILTSLLSIAVASLKTYTIETKGIRYRLNYFFQNFHKKPTLRDVPLANTMATSIVATNNALFTHNNKGLIKLNDAIFVDLTLVPKYAINAMAIAFVSWVIGTRQLTMEGGDKWVILEDFLKGIAGSWPTVPISTPSATSTQPRQQHLPNSAVTSTTSQQPPPKQQTPTPNTDASTICTIDYKYKLKGNKGTSCSTASPHKIGNSNKHVYHVALNDDNTNLFWNAIHKNPCITDYMYKRATKLDKNEHGYKQCPNHKTPDKCFNGKHLETINNANDKVVKDKIDKFLTDNKGNSNNWIVNAKFDKYNWHT